MSAYGQVYWYGGSIWRDQDTRAWRGILMNEAHDEVWIGNPEDHPDKAFEAMKAAAPKHKITDLRPWSGTP